MSSLRVVTFDLDDTLWETNSTLDRASCVMFNYIKEKGLRFNHDTPSFDRLIRQVMEESPAKSHDYTWGRLTALERSFIASGYSPEESQSFSEEVFNVWHEARHQVLFFEDSLPALEKLKQFTPKNKRLNSTAENRFSSSENLQNSTTWSSTTRETDDQACSQSQNRKEVDEGAKPVIKQKKIENNNINNNNNNNNLLIGALTNGNACIWRVGLRHIFHFKLNARDAGAAKPDPIFFNKAITIIENQHHSSCPSATVEQNAGLIDITMETNNCCERVRVQPSQILHVGDNPKDDIMGAKKMGFRTCWVNRKAESWPESLKEWQPDLIVSNLWELLDWLMTTTEEVVDQVGEINITEERIEIQPHSEEVMA